MYFPVSKWLKVMFPEVMFCPSELSSASADSLSRCDLEVCVLGGGGGGGHVPEILLALLLGIRFWYRGAIWSMH